MPIFPFIKVTQKYNDDNTEAHERPLYLLPEFIHSFTHFEIAYNDTYYNVKEDAKEIRALYMKKLKEMVEDDKEGLL